MSDIDILQIHQSILEKFKKEEREMKQYELKLQEIIKSIGLSNLRHRTLECLEENKIQLEEKIKNIQEKTTYNFYIMETTELLDAYTTLLHSPVKVNFMGKQKIDDINKDEIITKYCSIAKNYTTEEIHFYKQTAHKIMCVAEACKKRE